jgi:hypothetical protein
VLKVIQYKKEKFIIKNKHERLYVAVQELLIELGITPERLRDIAANRTHGHIKPIVTSNTAQKLIDAGLIAEEVNWRKPGKVLVSDRNNEVSEVDVSSLDPRSPNREETVPEILWSYLREKHPDFIYEQIKDYLFPGY